VGLVSFRSDRPKADVPRLRRDGLTFTLYGPFVAWGLFLYTYGPSVPLLAADQRITDAQAGLHGTASAVGGFVAAFLAPRVVLRWGRRAAIVGGAVTLAVAIVAFLLGPSLPWTLGAVFAIAVCGNVMFAAAQVGLALHHGLAASAVITEGNALGTAVGLLGPLLLGAATTLGWGWRPAVAVSVLVVLVSAALVSRLPESAVLTRPAWTVPDEPRPAMPTMRQMWRPEPLAALFVAGVVAANAVESSTTYWSTALLMEQTGAGAGVATAAAAGLLVGMSTTRFVVGPLSLRVHPAHLLAGAFVLSIGGWAVVWTAGTTTAAVVGLVLAGFGMGAQYPLSVALLLAVSSGHTDRAQGQATLFGALAVAVAPFLLGALSDHVGMHRAFVVVPVYAVAGAIAVAAGGRAMRRAAVPVRA
jgi:MFS family permease